MDEHNLPGVMTRSKSARVKEALLAPSKFDTPKVASDLQSSTSGGDNVQAESALSPTSSSFSVYRDPSLSNRTTIDLKSQSTFPNASVSISSATTGGHSSPAEGSQTCPIVRDLVVCCSVCRVIYQQPSNSSFFTCPLCSQLKVKNQVLETALSEIRSSTALITERLADLEKSLLALRTEVISLKSDSVQKNDTLKVSKEPIGRVNTINTSVLLANLDEQMDTEMLPA